MKGSLNLQLLLRSRLCSTNYLRTKVSPNGYLILSRSFAQTAGAGVKGDNIPPPPPEKKGQSGGNGFWILLVAALAGGGYYFRDELSNAIYGNKEQQTTGKSVPVKDTKLQVDEMGVKDVKETRKLIEDSEERLKQANPEKPIVVVETSEKKLKEADVAAEVSAEEVDWSKVRAAIVDILDDENYDDGSLGPLFVRLAWHNAGTYDKKTGKGGSEGAAMRFEPEAKWGANAGLDIARDRLEPVKKKFPKVTYSDLWSFAGTVAIEEMGGPQMKWRPGRRDVTSGENILPDGLLPDADGRGNLETPQDHVRFIFGRMGFNDQEMVALLGGHALGRCHTNRSGYWGPWTNAPTTFSNEFFRLLLNETWSKKKTHQGAVWSGPEQYENPSGELMMLPTDMCLVWDPKFKQYVELYAKDEEKFFEDFAKAWLKLQELGVKKFHGWRRYIFFGPRE